MENSKVIAARMDEVKGVFLHAQLIAAGLDELDEVIKKLAGFNAKYQLIAYEAAAMVLALHDLKEDNQLSRWRSFLERINEPIVPHAHLGLGWAFARLETSTSILKTIDPAMRFRVVDGWGYYNGTFRSRVTIKSRKLPENFSNHALHVYDQGLGRSLWYACQGQIDVLQEIIQTFPASRHPDLWRGIGIACSFVGGCDEGTLETMRSVAAAHQIQLAIGATMAAKARIQTHSTTKDIELACQVWCQLSAQEAMLLAVNSENNVTWKDEQWEDSYAEFISNMIKGLTLVNTRVLVRQPK
jgi:hypothetical protein